MISGRRVERGERRSQIGPGGGRTGPDVGAISAVSDTFPRAGRLVKGYDVEQVEAFLSRARAAYEDSGRGPAMTSWHVRTVGFDLVRGRVRRRGRGRARSTASSDAFARREKQRGEERAGTGGWQTQLRTQEQSLRAQLARPDGDRFPPRHRHGAAPTTSSRSTSSCRPHRGGLRQRPGAAARRRPARRVQEPPGQPRVPRGLGRRLPRPCRRAPAWSRPSAAVDRPTALPIDRSTSSTDDHPREGSAAAAGSGRRSAARRPRPTRRQRAPASCPRA